MRPHLLIHRRCHDQRRRGGQAEGGQQVIGQPMGEAGDEIRRGRGDYDPPGPARQLNMPHAGLGLIIEQFSVHRIAGHCLEGKGGDESLGSAGHDHPHIGALVAQPAHQFSRLVGRDTAGNPQHDVLAVHFWSRSMSASAAAEKADILADGTMIAYIHCGQFSVTGRRPVPHNAFSTLPQTRGTEGAGARSCTLSGPGKNSPGRGSPR
jgi:hypothetical protein